MTTLVQIKGIREGLLITLGDGSWDDVHRSLLTHLDEQSGFLRGARLALDVGNHILKAVDLGQVSKEISERGLTLWAVISNSPTTERSAQSFGLATRIGRPKPEGGASASAVSAAPGGEGGILVRRTLRSGASLHHTGHVVVIGDVNPGAEVVSDGDVIVWGRMRGMVHAGANGNEAAVVCALDLSPTQLRIAGQFATSPRRRGRTQPEMARIIDGQVVAEPWVPKREKI